MDPGKFFERLDELFKQGDLSAVESFMLRSLSELECSGKGKPGMRLYHERVG